MSDKTPVDFILRGTDLAEDFYSPTEWCGFAKDLAAEVRRLREELASSEAYAATLFTELEHERNAIGRVDTLLTLLEQDSVVSISAAGQIRQALQGKP